MRRVLLCIVLTIALLPGSAARADGGLSLSPPVPGEVLRGFDEGLGPYEAGHRGVDLDAEAGESIRAAAAGTVTFAGRVATRPSVSITHADGRRTTYTPVIGSVLVGQQVNAGDVIGTLSTDRHCATQDCLHWGLTDGVNYWDPLGSTVTTHQIRLLPRGTRPSPPPVPTSEIPAGSRPVAGPITSRFGMRVHPVTGVHKLHDGVDFAAACGTTIVAPWTGQVSQAHYSAGYGYRIVIDHGGGFSTAYAHLSGLELAVGEQVPAGGRVGSVGTTGLSTGCHLHWMAWVGGRLVDPLTLG